MLSRRFLQVSSTPCLALIQSEAWVFLFAPLLKACVSPPVVRVWADSARLQPEHAVLWACALNQDGTGRGVPLREITAYARVWAWARAHGVAPPERYCRDQRFGRRLASLRPWVDQNAGRVSSEQSLSALLHDVPDVKTILVLGFNHLSRAQLDQLNRVRAQGVQVRVFSQPFGQKPAPLRYAPEEGLEAQSHLAWSGRLEATQSGASCEILTPPGDMPWASALSPHYAALNGLFHVFTLVSGSHLKGAYVQSFYRAPLFTRHGALALAHAEKAIAALPVLRLSLERCLLADCFAGLPELQDTMRDMVDSAHGSRTLFAWMRFFQRAREQLGWQLEAGEQKVWERALQALNTDVVANRAGDYVFALHTLGVALDSAARLDENPLAHTVGARVWLTNPEGYVDENSALDRLIHRGAHAPDLRQRGARVRRLTALLRQCGAKEVILCASPDNTAVWPWLKNVPFFVKTECKTVVTPHGFGEERAPSVGPHESLRALRALLSQQMACPFQAFARQCLQVGDAVQPIGAGPDARVRGNLVHTVLSHAAEGTLVDDESERDWERVCDVALQDMASVFAVCGPAWQRVEKDRLLTMLRALRTADQARPGFDIEAREQNRKLTLAGRVFSMRLDRVDRLEDGRLLVLDYKTGAHKKSLADYLAETMTDPQLALYALVTGAEGVALAYVRPDVVFYQGIGAESAGLRFEGMMRCPPSEWEAQLRLWQARVEDVFTAFCQGNAQVAPRKDDVCRTCGMQALCRIGAVRDGHL